MSNSASESGQRPDEDGPPKSRSQRTLSRVVGWRKQQGLDETERDKNE